MECGSVLISLQGAAKGRGTLEAAVGIGVAGHAENGGEVPIGPGGRREGFPAQTAHVRTVDFRVSGPAGTINRNQGSIIRRCGAAGTITGALAAGAIAGITEGGDALAELWPREPLPVSQKGGMPSFMSR